MENLESIISGIYASDKNKRPSLEGFTDEFKHKILVELMVRDAEHYFTNPAISIDMIKTHIQNGHEYKLQEKLTFAAASLLRKEYYLGAGSTGRRELHGLYMLANIKEIFGEVGSSWQIHEWDSVKETIDKAFSLVEKNTFEFYEGVHYINLLECAGIKIDKGRIPFDSIREKTLKQFREFLTKGSSLIGQDNMEYTIKFLAKHGQNFLTEEEEEECTAVAQAELNKVMSLRDWGIICDYNRYARFLPKLKLDKQKVIGTAYDRFNSCGDVSELYSVMKHFNEKIDRNRLSMAAVYSAINDAYENLQDKHGKGYMSSAVEKLTKLKGLGFELEPAVEIALNNLQNTNLNIAESEVESNVKAEAK